MGLFVAISIFGLGLYALAKLASKLNVNLFLLLSGWIFKLVCSIIFVWIFSLSGIDGTSIQGDSYNFFFDSGILADHAQKDFWGYFQLLFGFHTNETELMSTHLAATNIWSYGNNGDFINDNRLIIRINSVVHFFSFGNFYVHVLIFSGLAYTGILMIYKAFESYVSNKKIFLVSLILFPSIAFWGSGLTKETLTIFGLGLFFFSLNKILFDKKSLLTFIVLIVACFILLFNKPYVGIVLIPSMLFLFVAKKINWKPVLIPIWIVVIIIGSIVLSYLPEKINLVDKLSFRQRDMINLGKGGLFFVTDSSFCAFDYSYFNHFDTLATNKIKVVKETPGDYKLFGPNPFHPFNISPSEKLYERYLVQEPSQTYIDITPINNSGIQLVKNISESIVNTTVRPFPGEVNNFYGYFIFVVNCSLLIFIACSIYLRKKLSNIEKNWFFLLMSSALILILIIGWTSPVIGAIIRYKVPAEILILVALHILIKPLQKKNSL